MEVNFKARLDMIPIGSRIGVTCEKANYSGTLDEVAEDGIAVSWFAMEWQTVNSKQQEVMLRTSVFLPFDQIIDYMVTR